jgi:hypothetical protein
MGLITKVFGGRLRMPIRLQQNPASDNQVQTSCFLSDKSSGAALCGLPSNSSSLMSSFIRLCALTSAFLLAASSHRVEAARPGSQTIAEIVVANTAASEPQFTLLLAALEYTGLTSVFTGNTPYTVFALTDDAFLNLLEALEATSLADIDAKLGEGAVAKVLLFHVTRGVRFSQSVVGNKEIATLNGQPAVVDGATIEGAAS